MARKDEKNQAIKLREQGLSYSQIKDTLGINKSTLSGWLSGMPLSKVRLDELQRNENVIEKIRTTKLLKRKLRVENVYDRIKTEIGLLTNRELFVAGFFLYWAEGGKTTKYTASLSNTDPRMVRAFIKWLKMIQAPINKMYIRLHLYSDMNELAEIDYWAEELKISKTYFKKSYIKNSKLSDLTYITRGHGTCNVIMPGRDISEYVLQGQQVIADMY